MTKKESGCPGPYASGSGPVDITDVHVTRYRETREAEGLEGLTNDGMQNVQPANDLRSLSVNNYFPGKGDYGGAGCMI